MVGVDRTPVLESTIVPAALRAIRTSSFSVVNKRRLNELALTALALIHLSTANIVLPQIVGCCAIAQQGLNPAVICSRAKMGFAVLIHLAFCKWYTQYSLFICY